jgi:hypothetical protein
MTGTRRVTGVAIEVAESVIQRLSRWNGNDSHRSSGQRTPAKALPAHTTSGCKKERAATNVFTGTSSKHAKPSSQSPSETDQT